MKPDNPQKASDILMKHLTHELDQEIERVMKDKNLTLADIVKHTEAMNENRTEYRKKLRKS